jgi:hypothetical protein
MTVRDEVVAGARRWLGTPYDWGGEGMGGEGVDCSGLVIAAFREAGVPLSGRPIASQLGGMGTGIELDQALPGDLIYYDRPGPTDHVGVYVGGGKMIDSPTQGQTVGVRDVGNPTSIRRLLTGGSDFAGASTSGSAAVDESFLDKINPFDNWAEDVLGIGVKLVGTFAALGLVVVGVMHTVKD